MSNDAEDKFDEEHGLEERGSAKESRMEGAMIFCRKDAIICPDRTGPTSDDIKIIWVPPESNLARCF
jgi:hypothetical protein